MKRYKAIVEGVEEFFNVTPDRYDEFIAKHPDAVLVEGPETEESIQEKTVAQDPKKAKDSANGVSAESKPTAPESTEFPSVDILPESLDNRSIEVNGVEVTAKRYKEQFAGKFYEGNGGPKNYKYPDTFEEYATQQGANIVDPKEGYTENIGLTIIGKNPGKEIADPTVWQNAFDKQEDKTPLRSIETMLQDLSNFTVNRYADFDKSLDYDADNNAGFQVIHTNPEDGKITKFEIPTIQVGSGIGFKTIEGLGQKFSDFLGDTMSNADVNFLINQTQKFKDSELYKGLNISNQEIKDVIGTEDKFFEPYKEIQEVPNTDGNRKKAGLPFIIKGEDEDVDKYRYMQKIPLEVTIEPNKEALDKEIKKLQAQSPEVSVDVIAKQAKANVYSIAVANERLKLISAKREGFLSENSELRDEFLLFDNIKETLELNNYIDNNINIRIQESEITEIADKMKAVKDFSKTFKEGEQPVVIDDVEWGGTEDIIGTWEGLPITQNNWDQLNTIQSNYNSSYNSFIHSIDQNIILGEKLGTNAAKTNAAALNYSIAKKSLNTFGWGVADIVTGTGYAVAATAAGLTATTEILSGSEAVSADYEKTMSAVDKISNKYSAAKQKSRDSFVSDVSLEDSIDSFKNMGKFWMQEISTQAPIVLAMMATGAYGGLVIGLETGGQAGMEQVFSDALAGKKTDRVNQMLKMVGVALANSIPTQLVTVPILRKAKTNFINNFKLGTVEGTEQFVLSTQDFIQQEYKGVIVDILKENASEIVTNFAENAIYGNDPLENIGHVAVSSSAFSFVFSAFPFFKGIAARNVASRTDIEQLDSYAKNVIELDRALRNSEKSLKTLTDPDLKTNAELSIKAIKKDLANAKKAMENKANSILEKPLNGLTGAGSELLVESQNQASTIKAEISALISTNADKKIIDKKVLEFSILKNVQEDFINSGYRNEFALMETSNPTEYNEYIEKAKIKLNSDKVDNKVVLEATREYNMNKSRKKAIQNKRNTPGLIVLETRAEVAKAINSRLDLSDRVKQKAIDALTKENASAGISLTTIDGRKIPVMVIETEADNNKQYVQLHEVGHGYSDLIFKIAGNKRIELGNQLRLWLKENNSSLSTRMNIAMAAYESDRTYSPEDVADEVMQEFFEMVWEKRIDLTSSTNAPLNGMMAQMIQDGVGKDIYDYDFRGVDDFAAFAVHLAKGIQNGSVNIGKATETIKKITTPKVKTETKADEKLENVKESKPTSSALTLEQLTEKAEDLLEQSNLDSSNQDLLDKYYDTMDAIDAMEDAELNESTPVTKQVEKKQIAKDDTPQLPRKKKDRSTKRYTLTDQQKTEIEPLIAEAQILNKELIAKEKAATDARIKKITDKSEREMSRTDQAKAIADIKANPTRFEKGAKLTNLENKIQKKVKVPLDKLINAYTKRLYDGIPAQAKEVVSRDDYQTAARAVVITTLINEFKKNTTNRLGEKTTNDIEDLMFNRGYFRMLPLATAMGVSSKVEGIAQRFDNVANNIGTEDIMFDEKTNEPEMSMEGKFKISSFLPADAYDLALEQTKEFWEENVGNSPIENFKKLPSLVDDIMADIFGVSLNVFTARSGNLNATSYDNVLQAITKPYAVLKLTKNGKTEEIRIELGQVDAYESQLKDKGIEFERYADENILQTLFKFLPKLSADDYVYADGSKGRYRGKATGIPKNLVALTYENITRGTTGVGNRKANVGKQAYKDILNAIGGAMVDGKVIKRIGITGKSKEGQTLLGVLKLYNRMVTNEISRSPAVDLDPMTVKDIAAGKNNLMESKKTVTAIKVSDFVTDSVTEKQLDYLQGKLNEYVSTKGKTVAQQIKFVSRLAKQDWGIVGQRLFNNEFKYNLGKLNPEELKNLGIDNISKALGKAWGKTYNWVVRFQGLKGELDQLNADSSKENIETFILSFGRSLKNSKYQGTDRKVITTNESLFQEINQRLGPDQSLKNLGFELDIVPIINKDGKIVGERSFIYDVTGKKRKLVNPSLTVLDIKKQAFSNIDGTGLNVLNVSNLYRGAIKKVLKKYKQNDPKSGYAAIEAMFFGQVSAGRRIATLRKAYNFKGKATLEHVTSVDLTKQILRDFVDGKISETEYDAKLNELFVDVIPAELDKLLRKVGLEGRYDEEITYNGKKTTVNKELAKLGIPAIFNVETVRKSLSESKRTENAIKAVSLANNAKTPVKGISVWDFDDTLARTKSNVLYTMPNGTKGKLTAEEFAKKGDRLANEGAVYDFSEFSKVMNGEKGPMFAEAMARNKKFGNKNVYILTARPANSATAIHTFLKGLGLNIPVENITGLANSSPLAKADWVVEKAAEGYNNFYFADDHIGNVKAVQKVLNVLDVKNKVHQAVVKESKKLKKQYSAIIAKRRGGMTITDAEASSGYIEQQIDNSFEYMEGAAKDGKLPKQQLSKAKKLGLHFLANSPIKFPEDGYKIIDAIEVATKNKIDPFTFKNVDVLLDKYIDSLSLKPMDPNSEKEFTNKADVPNSNISIYDIANTREGQKAVRKAVDTNWGVKANPWCVIARQQEVIDNVMDFWDNVTSTNVDSQFAIWNTVYPDGEVVREVANQAGVQNRVVLTQAEMNELTIGKESRPGVIKTDEQIYDDEVNQDDGRVGILTYQEWIVLSDPNQTKEEFEAGGGVLYPPEPEQQTPTKGEPKMRLEFWDMYGSPDPKKEGSVGGWKIAFKDGKLLSLKNLGTDNQSWWDRMDRPTPDLAIANNKNTYTTINTKTGKTKINKQPVIKESKKLDNIIDGIVTSDIAADGVLATPATMALGSLDSQFNKFLEGSTGIESFKKYKSDKAKLKGRFKGKFDVFIPPSAEDFLGLLYQTLNKGKLGEAQIKFYENNLLKPYAKANSALRSARVRSIREFDAIKKKLKIVPKDLKRSFKFEDENGNMKDSLFTKEQAIRVYIWNSQGIEMPNLSQVDLAVLVNEVNANPELKVFADELLKLNRGMDSKAPSKNWMDGNIGIDLQANLNSVGRKQLLEVWQQNVDAIFSEENLNKLEAAYGPEYVKALESSLRRMRTGRSAAPVTDNEAGNNLITWLNSAVGNIMFFNNRSALLQMLSATNFLNFEDNNIIAAGKALMNIKQYSKDFVMLMNSDYLLDRRDGTRININEADIALIAKQSGIQGVIAKILEAGFLPTKYADSLAIGIGGATFYRTKVNALVKGGMSKAKAEAQAMQEFISVAETSQQSSDQSKISMEQAGSVGKIILAFNNTSSQYSRIIKRSVQDLYNRRGSDKANLARIVYYGGMQNLLFNFMQQAMFAAMWGGEDDEEVLDGKKAKIVNSMADGLLRGMGVKAAIFVAIKNTAIKLLERSKKDRDQDYRYYAIMGMLAVSPPLSSKASKLSKAASAYEYGEDKMEYGEFGLDSPELTIGANLVSFATSLPADRLLTKAINVSDALDASNEPWERLFMTMGWPKWTLSTKKESDLERAEDKAEIKTAKEKEEFDAMTPLEQKTKALEDLKKFQQVDSLKAYGLTDKEIRLLTKEEDRVNKILSLEGQEKKGLAPADEVEEELYDLKKQQQIDSLTKYGLTKKQIRLLKYEEDRVKAIIKLQNKKRKNSLK